MQSHEKNILAEDLSDLDSTGKYSSVVQDHSVEIVTVDKSLEQSSPNYRPSNDRDDYF
jgi:hypothetical protein